MTARTHDAFALASLISVAAFFPPASLNLTTLIVSVIGAHIGGLIPDMDQAGNRLWDMFPSGNSLGRIFRRIFYKHRTISHSLIGVFIFYKFLEFVVTRLINTSFIDPKLLIAGIIIGYLSHLLADSFTEEGLPLLFPLRIAFGIPPIKKIRIKTGQWFENLVIYPAIWIYLFSLIQNKKEVLLEILKMVKS
ncbi:hypothetical protein A3A76_01520 [Candidatus Woesebacteria bacterium RIFCSPLOWO2_01_FULL_39_23]|uniref:Metal-dependent hydrolase n=1 Tax=Candidatus Woesebacteria bacterium RIFCSPHIGHO2_01_FULL_40_22 TaxID=1802499 RepID=A0A1F7YGN4_9BACT|nr:MAG: hypothetical protein A2141_04850 [Candidatus Woesebacteria bacterium RBG_16_40_11]OGM26504.1 MAG: hypothetical protein A2628_03115 [Candidatus Woesebacteria bacterium RIFCSPHIGHO2_01_FULL_40_22]OGM37671.1 MAG: hypothetical protein A3E41_05635 [Candidatus Woesebacteria bacterium RIFCSPHIGHO2_12_FULL_38_9]OGM62957.1 MAG: hypothetical protein A3A76_01520 [Candidatus Woesebacteria bacterium RIFCSPLOWO2_01_FULL_39_23]